MKYANEVIVEQLKSDREFLKEHLCDAFNSLFTGDHRVACLMLRDIVNATIGFQQLAKKLGKKDKTVMGYLGGKSNPTISNLFAIVYAVIEHEHLVVDAQFKDAA